MYANAFSADEEFLLLELLEAALDREIFSSEKVDEFVGSDGVIPQMVITYNQRKQGKEYAKMILSGYKNFI